MSDDIMHELSDRAKERVVDAHFSINMLTKSTQAVLICAVTLCIFSACFSQQLRTLEQREKILTPHIFKNAKNESLPYRLFVPQNYDAKKKYPLVVYLHGGGGVGEDNLKQIDGGNGYLVDLFTGSETQARYPSLVVAPQAPESEGWINSDLMTPTRQLRLVYELIGEIGKSYSVDRSRVYVAGQSMGGLGSFAIIAEYPQTFAAGVPLCGGGDESKVAGLINTPIWTFHGAKDEAVPVERSRRMIAAMKKAGGRPHYTEYPDGDHVIWPRVVKEPELLPWLFKQRRSN
jgi:predicted peptidase